MELIDGEILEMTPIGAPHAGLVSRLTEPIVTRVAGRAHVSVQNPVRLERVRGTTPPKRVIRRSFRSR